MSPVLERISAPSDEALQLVDELEAELCQDYPEHQRHGYTLQRLLQPHIRFFIARLDGHAVGCGGIAFEEGFVELKRMYVRPPNRGRGIGRKILNYLEAEAQAGGATRLVLETGDVLHRAIAMYEGAGFTRCNAFGVYATLSPAFIQRSVFMEKRLGMQQIVNSD